MTAENAESNNASGGDDLRARYLPVSRKELRRRREAELASERGDETPEEVSTPEPETALTPAPPWGFAALINEKTREVREDDRAARDAAPDLDGDEVDESAVAEIEADAEEFFGAEEPGLPEDRAEADSDDADAESRIDTDDDNDTGGGTAAADEVEGKLEDTADEHASELIVETELLVDPEPITAAEQAEAEEELRSQDAAESDATEHLEAPAQDVELGGAEPEDLEPQDLEPEIAETGDAGSTEVSEPEASNAEGFIAPDDSAPALSLPEPPRNNAPAESDPARPQDLPSTEIEDEEDAPVPASRKSRRSLRLTGSMSVLSEEKLAELNELQQELSAGDDPNRVDPELLKKQQAFAARAMQANQERLREEQAEAERDQRMRRRRLRPESEVITRKALRAHMESDEAADQLDYATGSIEPIQARGAHGLEIDAMVEHSTRQGARQSMMGWLVIILAVLLVIAIGVVLSFIL